MKILGKLHKKGSAAQSDAVLLFANGITSIEIVDGITFSARIEDIVVSDRLGNVERKLTFDDGSIFTTHDNDAIDNLFKEHGKFNTFLHSIESHIGWVMLALVCTILSFFTFFKWGIPWASSEIADMLPYKVNEVIASHSFDFLDEYIFEESQLDNQQMERIRSHFRAYIMPLDKNFGNVKYRIHFREWKDNDIDIPNALALPSGDIILTDKFVELCQNQNEIDAVILHEMGHVTYHHSLEKIIASTFVTTIVMVITGDNNGFADLGLGLGSLLISSKYSRAHETEADQYAFKHMLMARIDPKAFSDIMIRMTEYMEDEKNIQMNDSGENKDKKNSMFDFLSSHPPTHKRVELARHYSECFKKGLLTCGSASPATE